MMRPIYSLFMALVLILLSVPSIAEDYQECWLRCAGERDTRNMDCPSPYDAADDERSQCLKDSQTDYENCINDCPAPPPTSPSGGQVSPTG